MTLTVGRRGKADLAQVSSLLFIPRDKIYTLKFDMIFVKVYLPNIIDFIDFGGQKENGANDETSSKLRKDKNKNGFGKDGFGSKYHSETKSQYFAPF